MKGDQLFVVHMLECISHIETFTKAGLSAYQSERLIQDAVLRNLQVLSESSQKLSVQLRNAHPEIPWRGIAGFRNVLVHDYMGIDHDEVWQIVAHFLPELKKKLSAIASDHGWP